MFTNTLQEQMSNNVHYVRPVPYGSATGLTAEVYRQMQADFMLGPLLTLHSPLPEVLAGAWSILRESLMAGQVDRIAKEVAAATVSKINECPFCIDAHTTMLHATSEHEVAGAILRGDYDSIRDPKLRAYAQWVLANQTPDTPGVLSPPFSQEEAPEMLATVITFQYLNRMANVFLGDSLLPVPEPLKGMARYIFGLTAGKRYVRPLPAGESLKFVPPANLPEDLSWAAGSPAVTGAFAGFVQVVEMAGEAVLPEPVRVFASRKINAWRGERMGFSRQWVEEMLVEVPGEQRAAARLVLLTALASYQVDAKIVADFQVQYPQDAQLIAVAAWASLAAARRIGLWLAKPFKKMER